MSKTNKPPVVPLEVADSDETREPTGERLAYNEEADSFELDAETNDSEYQHPDPYDTAATHGEDAMSTYDDANPFTSDEYKENDGRLAELDESGLGEPHIQFSDEDEALTEDMADANDEDLDETSYPAQDDAGGEDNSIQPAAE